MPHIWNDLIAETREPWARWIVARPRAVPIPRPLTPVPRLNLQYRQEKKIRVKTDLSRGKASWKDSSITKGNTSNDAYMGAFCNISGTT